MKKIVLIIGARPNFMKAFPVYQSLEDHFDLTLIHTGQHFDEKMSDIFFNQLKFKYPDIHLILQSKTKSGYFDDKLYINLCSYLNNETNLQSCDEIIELLMNSDCSNMGQLGEIRNKLFDEFKKIKPDLVIVFGDVTSTLAAGLAAKKLDIKLAHVESGLRSGDITMPEEINRILTDHISTYYFVTEQSGIDNLKKDKITKNVYFVGNTMIDTQKMYLQQALDTKYHEKLGVKKKEYILITLHRPGNVDDLDKLKEIFDDLIHLSKTKKLVYPIHPRTNKRLEEIGYLEKVQKNGNILLEGPLGYLEFTCLMANCNYIITDSGGIQEESTTLNIPCFTLRPNTERPCTLIENYGTNQLIKKISDIELKECSNRMDLWDGKSSERICKILIENETKKESNINKIKEKLGLSKRELNIYIKELKKKYDIPTKYTQNNELLEKTKNKEVVINNKTFKIDLPDLWFRKESNNTRYQIHTLNQIIQSQISLFLYKEYDTKIVEYCIEVIVNWFTNNEKVDMETWYKYMNSDWQDMSSSYRLGNILLVYELSKKFNISIDKELFLNEIKYHVEWLYKHSSSHQKGLVSNHTLFLARFLVLGCSVCNIYDKYIDFGIEIFLNAINTNVDFTDYLSKEHSTNYHILYYRQINKLLNILPETNNNYNKLKNINNKMYNNLYYFIYPNKHFVQIGDTDNKVSNYEFTESPILKTFKSAGYICYKNNNKQLLLSSNCHSKHHKHMDELSLTYYDNCPILIEGGRYSYEDNKVFNRIRNDNEPWRTSYFLTQKSKNSIVIDNNYYSLWNIEYLLDNNTLTYGSGIIESKKDENKIIMKGENLLLEELQGTSHQRSILYEPENNLLIEDNITIKKNIKEIYKKKIKNSTSHQLFFQKVLNNETKNIHSCTRHFHFHQDWELLEIKDNTVIFKHKILDKNIQFEDLSNGEIKYYYGQEEPFIQGFTSPSELKKIPIPTLEITNTFKENIKLISKITHINSDKIIIEKKIKNLDVNGHTKFLDHNNEHILLSNGGNTIYESYDFGKTWQTHILNIDDCYITHGKIINNKIFLATNDTNYNTYVYVCDENKKNINKNKIHLPWHGTWSIDYNESTIMFGTYAHCNENMYIYRSQNNGETWENVFTMKGDANDPKKGDIRHFHTCTYDKYNKIWYISSGDRREQNRMWESKDNGNTWKQIEFKLIKDRGDIKFGITSNYAKQLVRHTAEININENIMLWCTDDKIDGNARVCIFNKKTYELTIGEKLGKNPIRSFTKINNNYGLAISESKFKDNDDKLYVDFYLINLYTYRCKLIKTIDNIENKISGFNYSIASKNAYNNTMFCYSDFNNGYLQIFFSVNHINKMKDKDYILDQIEEYNKTDVLEFKYTNLDNENDVKILRKKIRIKNAVISKDVCYDNNHKRAILELSNSNNEVEKITLINNNVNPGKIENIMIIQSNNTNVFDVEEFTCNICNDNIHQKYINNINKINHIYLKENEIGNPASCYKCSFCNSRLRLRTLKKILHNVINEKESCIICSSPIQERKFVSKYLNIEKHIDYHIQRGDPTCEIGVDISKPIKTDKKYKYLLATCVFDYIIDLKSAFKNISDILENNGKIIFWISPYRLSEEYFEPKLKGTNALSHEKYAVKGNSETGINDCLFSIPWIEETLKNIGFELKIYNEQDILTDLNDRWFIACKK